VSAPLRLYRLAGGQFDRAALNAMRADFILIGPGRYEFSPSGILFEDVRLTTATSKSDAVGDLVRLEATEERPSAPAAQIEVFAGIVADTLEHGFRIDDDWFVVRRGGEQPLVERLAVLGHPVGSADRDESSITASSGSADVDARTA